MKKVQPETLILNAICEYLEYKHYSFWRQNNTPIFSKATNSFRAMPKYSMYGVSDVILLLDGVSHFIEVKTDKGKQSQHQKDFQAFVEEAGCKYYIVRSIDDLVAFGF